MGMGIGTRLYPLTGGDRDETKVWYPLDLGMGMGMNFFYGDGYGIAKPVPAPPRCHAWIPPKTHKYSIMHGNNVDRTQKQWKRFYCIDETIMSLGTLHPTPMKWSLATPIHLEHKWSLNGRMEEEGWILLAPEAFLPSSWVLVVFLPPKIVFSFESRHF